MAERRLYGSLSPSGVVEFTAGRGGAPILKGQFDGTYPETQRATFVRMVLQAENMIAILSSLYLDIEQIIVEAIKEKGGGATGLVGAQSDPEFAPLFDRKDRIEDMLRRVGRPVPVQGETA